MNLKNLNKAAAILEEVKLLDEEIIRIERFAEKVSLGEYLNNIKFSFVKAKGDEPEEEKFKEHYAQLIHHPFSFMIRDGIRDKINEKRDELEKEMNLKYKDISDSLMLEFLSLVLHHKNEYRKSLLQKISKLGVQI